MPRYGKAACQAARQAHGAAQTMRWQWKGGATLSGTGPKMWPGETSPGTMQGPAGKVGVEWSLDSHRAAREPGNGRQARSRGTVESMYTDQAGCRDAAGRQAGASMGVQAGGLG